MTVNWSNVTTYTLPRPGGIIPNVTYAGLTNNSILSDTMNVLFPEQSTLTDAYLVAAYPQPVSVDEIFLGGGNVSGWTNVIHVFGGQELDLEYSNDGINWTLAPNGPIIPTSAIIQGLSLIHI